MAGRDKLSGHNNTAIKPNENLSETYRRAHTTTAAS